jgi:uncharacterized phage protein (TIGR02220 family)
MTPHFWKYLLVSSKRKKYVTMWADIASNLDDLPVHFSFKELCAKHELSRSSLYRHMEEVRQFWDKSETKLGQKWDRGGIGFEQLTEKSETKVRQNWDKVETKVKQQKPKKKVDENEDVRQQIIDYLNDKTGKRYRPTNQKTIKFIDARIKEGYNYNDFRQVIDNKSKVWLGTSREIYLRPETLFGNRFDSYLNEKPKNPELFLHQKISNHVTKAERYDNAINEAGTINFAEFVEVDKGDEDNS